MVVRIITNLRSKIDYNYTKIYTDLFKPKIDTRLQSLNLHHTKIFQQQMEYYCQLAQDEEKKQRNADVETTTNVPERFLIRIFVGDEEETTSKSERRSVADEMSTYANSCWEKEIGGRKKKSTKIKKEKKCGAKNNQKA